MKKINIEFTEEEMRSLAEMCSVMMVLIGLGKNEISRRELKEQSKLPVRLLSIAAKEAKVGEEMEMNKELGHWYFKPEHVEGAFFSSLLGAMRETVFWEELVMRMAEHTLYNSMPKDEVEQMTELERRMTVGALEQAIWSEVARHGLDRLTFVLPELEP